MLRENIHAQDLYCVNLFPLSTYRNHAVERVVRDLPSKHPLGVHELALTLSLTLYQECKYDHDNLHEHYLHHVSQHDYHHGQ